MRLLLIADLHYSLPQFDWVLDIADGFDAVVMAGDHLDLASLVDGRAQSVVVRKYFSRLGAKTTLMICSGNHDLDVKNESGERIAKWIGGSRQEGVLSDGESFVIDDTLFTACPWWDGPLVRAGIATQLAEASTRRAECWIWIHHAPPAKSATSWGGDRYFGDVELREWIEQYRPASSSPATCISRHSSRTAHGSIASARHGCSTPASNSARRPPISSSIPTKARRYGFPPRGISSSVLTIRSSARYQS